MDNNSNHPINGKSPAMLALHGGMILILFGLFLMLFPDLTIEIQQHDTYFIILYGHLFLFQAVIILGFGMLHKLFAFTFGMHYSERLARWHLLLTYSLGLVLLVLLCPYISATIQKHFTPAAFGILVLFSLVQCLIPINLFRAIILRFRK